MIGPFGGSYTENSSRSAIAARLLGIQGPLEGLCRIAWSQRHIDHIDDDMDEEPDQDSRESWNPKEEDSDIVELEGWGPEDSEFLNTYPVLTTSL